MFCLNCGTELPKLEEDDWQGNKYQGDFASICCQKCKTTFEFNNRRYIDQEGYTEIIFR